MSHISYLLVFLILTQTLLKLCKGDFWNAGICHVVLKSTHPVHPRRVSWAFLLQLTITEAPNCLSVTCFHFSPMQNFPLLFSVWQQWLYERSWCDLAITVPVCALHILRIIKMRGIPLAYFKNSRQTTELRTAQIHNWVCVQGGVRDWVHVWRRNQSCDEKPNCLHVYWFE